MTQRTDGVEAPPLIGKTDIVRKPKLFECFLNGLNNLIIYSVIEDDNGFICSALSKFFTLPEFISHSMI